MKKYASYIVFLVAAIVIVYLKFQHHELWKDEWQAYLVARDMSWRELFSFLNYEGHPSLWYIWLKLGSLFSSSFYPQEEGLIALMHSIPLVISTYLLTVSIRSNWIVKLGVLFSYFFCFEYGIVNRGYILVILGGLAFVYLIQQEKYRSFLGGLVLFLLCQTEVYGVMIGSVLLVYCLIDSHSEKSISYLKTTIKNNKWLLGLYSLGVVVFIYTVWPRGSEEDFTRAYQQSSLNLEVIMTAIQGNLANVFAIGLIEDTKSIGYTTGGLVLSFLSFILVVFLFIKNKALLVSWLFLSLGFIAFSIFLFAGGVRQWGMLFMGFSLLVLVLEFDLKDFFSLVPSVLLMLAPIVYNLRALSLEVNYPYSNALETGDFIKENIPEAIPIISLNKFETAAAGAYADRKFYELPSGEPFTYFKWLERVYIPTQSELLLFAQYKKVDGVAIISPVPIDLGRFNQARLWQKFDRYSIKRENFYIYSLSKN